MKDQRATRDPGTQSLVTDVFGGLSREELLTALSLMHEILEADRKGDVERIVTALSELRREATEPKPTPRKARNERPATGAPSPRKNYSHRVVRYFFSCLTKMQTRLAAEPDHPHMPSDTRHLSPRELTVLLWMKEGKTNWEISPNPWAERANRSLSRWEHFRKARCDVSHASSGTGIGGRAHCFMTSRSCTGATVREAESHRSASAGPYPDLPLILPRHAPLQLSHPWRMRQVTNPLSNLL